MAIETYWKYGQTGNFNNTLQPTERIWMSATEAQRSNLEVGQWSPATLIANDDGSVITGAANNCRYASTTEVSINEASPVELSESFISQGHCSLKITWRDTLINTNLSSCKFYAFNGVDPNYPPEEVSVVAFERTDTAINKNRVGGDTTGAAWDGDRGVNTSTNALALDDQGVASLHEFYIGFCLKVLAYGLHTNAKLRLSFDVS